jgi:hypothetical protein
MKKGLKILGVLVLVFAVFFTMSIRDAEAAMCYKYYFSRDFSTWGLGYMVLNSDGTFQYVEDGGGYAEGFWLKWGTSYAFEWEDDCYSFGAGTLAKGFEKCQDGSGIGYYPLFYQMKKTSCNNVPF